MAKNDVVLVDAIINDRLSAENPSTQRDEVFEYFAFEQVLKEFDLSREEIESGWVDGRNDGGIDGFFVLVNGHLLQDPKAFFWPKRNAEIAVYILTCKHHDTFQQAPLNSIFASITELLDLSREDAYLKERYSAELLDARKLLIDAYRQLSSVRPSLKFNFCYISRGDSASVGEAVQARADQIVAETESLFSQCRAEFSFVGATQLILLFRKTKSFNFDLQAMELMTSGPANYVAIVSLNDYKDFITDESGNLRRYLFDSNVRDYLGDTRVNEDIARSLADASAPEFWWLNNGVTLLATGAKSGGKIISLQDTQIVNGLQTTESIFRHFQTGTAVSLNRGLLVKVIVSADPTTRDQIIRATNNQSLVESASLHATDKLQRDIEEILERHDWYYERRKNYYRNIGKPASRFVTPLYIAAGYLSLLKKKPGLAVRIKSRFMRTQAGYESVFSTSIPLAAWVTITEVLKRVEATLSEIRSSRPNESEKFLASWRNLIALFAVARLLGTFAFSAETFMAMDLNMLNNALIRDTWQLVDSERKPGAQREFRTTKFIHRCCTRLNESFGVLGLEIIVKESPLETAHIELSEEFIDTVNRSLPDQPWNRGTHWQIAQQLNCSRKQVKAAVDELMSRGVRTRQKAGVLYNMPGTIATTEEKPAPVNSDGSINQNG